MTIHTYTVTHTNYEKDTFRADRITWGTAAIVGYIDDELTYFGKACIATVRRNDDEPVNGCERPEDTVRRFAGELMEIDTILAEVGHPRGPEGVRWLVDEYGLARAARDDLKQEVVEYDDVLSGRTRQLAQILAAVSTDNLANLSDELKPGALWVAEQIQAVFNPPTQGLLDEAEQILAQALGEPTGPPPCTTQDGCTSDTCHGANCDLFDTNDPAALTVHTSGGI